MIHFRIAVLALAFVLSCIPLIQAEYSIDDRDSRISYFGARGWGQHSDSGYMGTTTDNACFTQDACYFTVSFAGSGIQLVRFTIREIAIPLLATVTLDGVPRTGISIPDDQAVVVYDLQGFLYGDHVLRVDLLSWNATEPSHFRLDQAIINDTRAASTTSTSSSTTTFVSTTSRSSSTSPSPSTPSSSSTGRAINKKISTGAVLGSVAALLTFSFVLM